MGIEDRDWYRSEYKQKTGNSKSVLTTVINQTEKRRRSSSLKIALTWIALAAALYAVFTLAGHFTR